MNKVGFISDKGIKPIVVLIVLTIIASLVSDILGAICTLITLAALYVFKDVQKYIYENSDSVLSPINGKIVAIDKIDGKLKIYCKISLWDDHVIRSPFLGELKVKKYYKGLNLNPNTLKAKSLNEQIIYKFHSDDQKTSLKLKLLSGICNVSIDKIEDIKLSQGERVSFFIDGIAIITIKEECDLLVNIGDKVSSGQSILYKK
jgi:hypothetical protein